jgi:ABC-2 type transport system permease protein
MLRRLIGLIRKEFVQILRDHALAVILIWAFTAAIYTGGHGRAMEVTKLPTAVYDLSRSPQSREFLSHIQPPYFRFVAFLNRENEISQWLDSGAASMVIVIPPDFQRKIDGKGQAHIQVITDGTLAIQATVAVAYIESISAQYSISVLRRRVGRSGVGLVKYPQVDPRIRVKFNQNMSSTWFGSLLGLFNMFTMVSLLLTAANLVREKEHGTLEQLMVSPARPLEIFLAKIIPTVVVVLGLSVLSFVLVLEPAFKIPIRGSLLLFYSVSALYVFAMTSMGIAIAVVAKNLAQAMLIMLLILQPMVLLSGAWGPPEAMSTWMRWLGLLSPLRHFIDFGYGVILKGNGLAFVAKDIAAISLLGLGLFTFSLWWFRRSLAK